MRHLRADIGAVLRDLLPVLAATIGALAIVLVAGTVAHAKSTPLVGALVVNEGLVLLVLGLLGWLVLVGRHLYSRGGRR